jgi:hypothetical protein
LYRCVSLESTMQFAILMVQVPRTNVTKRRWPIFWQLRCGTAMTPWPEKDSVAQSKRGHRWAVFFNILIGWMQPPPLT